MPRRGDKSNKRVASENLRDPAPVLVYMEGTERRKLNRLARRHGTTQAKLLRALVHFAAH